MKALPYVLAAFSLGLTACPVSAQDPVKVLAALQPLYSIAATLADGTNITVEATPASLPGMGGLARTFARPDDATLASLADADAVVSVESLWPEDPLFLEARERNILVIEIDVGRALSKGHQGVAQIAAPAGDVPWREGETSRGASPYVWFSPSNAITMAEIVAADFSRLSADDAPTIAANLSRFTSEVQALKAEYEQKFLDIPPSANLYALTDRFVYLTNEFGLFVDGYFLEQDVRWTDDDFAGLADLIESNGITHVLHHWQPDAAIEVAIGEAGAQLVILQDVDGLPLEDDATPDPDTYLATLRADLEMLYAALSEDLL